VFRRRVVVVDGLSRAGINGVVNRAMPDTISLAADNPTWHSTAGHELLHHLEIAHPDLFQALDSLLKPLLIRMDSARKKYATYLNDPDPDLNIRREVYADFLSDSFADPKFWAALEQRQPNLQCCSKPLGYR
jgi:hypothetical protein